MRVLLADDQAWLRSAVRLLLEQETDIEVVGEASEATVLLSITQAVSPDLLLLDWELPGSRVEGCGEYIIRRLHSTCPDVAIIVMSGRPEANAPAMNAGADHFVSKAEPPEVLLQSVRDVQRKIAALRVD